MADSTGKMGHGFRLYFSNGMNRVEEIARERGLDRVSEASPSPGKESTVQTGIFVAPMRGDIVLCLTAPFGAGNVMTKAALFPVLRIRDQPSLDRCEQVGQPPMKKLACIHD